MDAEIESLLQEDNDRSKRDLDRRREMRKQAGGFIGQRKLIGHELKMRKMKFNIISNVVQLILVVMLGSLVMLWLEPWNFMMTFYWATETITTVGYGNLVPTNDASKWFFIFYALIGTFVFAKAVGYIAALPVTRHRMMAEKRVLEQFEMGLSAEMLQSFFDRDEEVHVLSKSSLENKTVNRAEFAIHALLLLERITPRDLADANDAFEQLDIDDNETLDENDVARFSKIRRYVSRNHASVSGGGNHHSTHHVLTMIEDDDDDDDEEEEAEENPLATDSPAPAPAEP